MPACEKPKTARWYSANKPYIFSSNKITKHERRMTAGGTKELNACIDVMYSVYLKSDLCSSGLRSFPQYRDHQMLLILERNYFTLEVWK